jgi:hypothetical protein
MGGGNGAEEITTALTQQLLIEKRQQMRRMQQLALRRKQQAEMERIAKQQAQLKALADEKASLDANTNDNKSDMKSIEAVEAAKVELAKVTAEADRLRHQHIHDEQILQQQLADEDNELSIALGVKVPDTSAADTMLASYEVNVSGATRAHNRHQSMAMMADATSALSMNLMQQMMVKKRAEAKAARMAALKANQQRALTEANKKAVELKREASIAVTLPPSPYDNKQPC